MSDVNLGVEGFSVLVVDDEPGMRTALNANFLRHGWNVQTAAGVLEASRAIRKSTLDLVVTDVRMRDGDGFEVMELTRQSSPSTAVILLTAYGSVSEAVESMRNGAFDYMTKPVSFDQLQTTARRVVERARAVPAKVVPASAAGKSASGSGGIVGRSAALQSALARARAAANTDADILVEAESGTGKELLARYIHEMSARSGKPFVAINCAAVPESLIESELFGHSRGAFTGASAAKKGKIELADGGTLLLDEIGEMPLSLQPKLLRVLQEREFERLGETRTMPVDMRIVATTNASLGSMVERGTFRSDLYYRLNVIPLSLPPLRHRKEDIEALAQHFASRFATSRDGSLPKLEESFLRELQKHDWPGNVRELSNFLRRVLSLNQGMRIDAASFQREFHPLGQLLAVGSAGPGAVVGPPGARIADIEKIHLANTLLLANGNRTHAAEMLGVSLRTVRNKIKEYGLPPRSYA